MGGLGEDDEVQDDSLRLLGQTVVRSIVFNSRSVLLTDVRVAAVFQWLTNMYAAVCAFLGSIRGMPVEYFRSFSFVMIERSERLRRDPVAIDFFLLETFLRTDLVGDITRLLA